MAANENWLKSLNKYFRSGSFGFSGFQIISFGFRSFRLNSFSDQLWPTAIKKDQSYMQRKRHKIIKTLRQ